MPVSCVIRRSLLIALIMNVAAIIWLPNARAQTADTFTATTTKRDANEIQILYTGNLLGYFRKPDWQSPTPGQACTVGSKESRAATDFNQVIDRISKSVPQKNLSNAILVGSGNNFSPEIEAREFCSPPTNQFQGQKRAGKDSFVWNDETNSWVSFENFDLQSAKFKEKTLQGKGTIPEDNVARFLTEHGYAAVVPGRHDFYFGPERLRLLARLLASDPIPENVAVLHRPGYGTQMLGANLVIETTWKSDHAPLTDKENPPRFIPRLPAAAELGLPQSIKIEMQDLPPGGNAYPWYVGPNLKISNFVDTDNRLASIYGNYQTGPELEERLKTELKKDVLPEGFAETVDAFNHFKVNLCEVNPEKQPDFDQNTKTSELNEASKPESCHNIGFPFIVNKQGITLPLTLPWHDTSNTYTLKPGLQYRLCLSTDHASVSDRDGDHTFCLRLSVYQPLFQFPWGSSAESCAKKSCDYKDPDPYLVLEQKTNPNTPNELAETAIFGVVDPGLTKNIGLLNYGWINENKNYKTIVAAKDPAEALKELLAHFDRRQREMSAQRKGSTVTTTRVLLAEMSPQQAEVLAARVGGFQVVVTEADEPLSKPLENDTKLVEMHAATDDVPPPEMPPVVLIPSPFFRPGTAKGITDIGFLGLQSLNKTERETRWLVTSFHRSQDSLLYLEADSGNKKTAAAASDSDGTTDSASALTEFREKVHDALRGCSPGAPEQKTLSRPNLTPNDAENIRNLTLCMMQRNTKADLVLMQKRDFFTYLPSDFSGLPEDHKQFQEILDRIIWKGDFLSLIYVPGSAIKKAMEQSRAFDNEDNSALSLSDERSRGLATLGITPDSERDGYTINGLPLDPNKLYAVATTDYISAGDTGYPDLASSQIDQPTVGTDFGRKLTSISSLVCRSLPSQSNCEPDFQADSYFDFLQADPVDPRKGKTAGKQLEIWSLFYHPHAVPGAKAAKPPAAEETVQQRPLWDFALNKLTLGITRLAHTGSNFDVTNNFSGITSPGVNSLSSTTVTSDFQATWSRSFRRNQFYLSPAYTYNVQYKGQPDDFTQLNQIADLGSFDLGYIHSTSKRGPEHFDFTATEHFETPLTSAFNAFTLNTTHPGEHGELIKDQLRFHIDRSYTLLTRPGIRWKKRVSSIEFGPEWGHEWNALTGINFTTAPTVISCPAISTQTIGQCFKASVNAMRPTTLVASTRNGQDHTGTYWKVSLTVPFHPRVSYVLTDVGDWFFVHYGTENSTTTLLRDYSQHQLKFTIFPSFSIGPELDVLLYRNKSVGPLQGHFLFQDQFIMKAQWNFDLFNKRDKRRQIEYAPPASPASSK